MEMAGDDLFVDSKGHCFLCLEHLGGATPNTPPDPEAVMLSTSSSSTYSLRQFARHLNMDMGKVLTHPNKEDHGGRGMMAGFGIPPEMLAKVDRSQLRVELCEECICFTERFSGLYRQLEEIQGKVTSVVKLILGRFLKGEGSGRSQQLTRKLVNSQGSGGEDGRKPDIVEGLRVEAMEKCARHLNLGLGPPTTVRARLGSGLHARETNNATGSPEGRGAWKEVGRHGTSGRTQDPEGSSCPKTEATGFTLEHPVPEDERGPEVEIKDDLGTPAELDVDVNVNASHVGIFPQRSFIIPEPDQETSVESDSASHLCPANNFGHFAPTSSSGIPVFAHRRPFNGSHPKKVQQRQPSHESRRSPAGGKNFKCNTCGKTFSHSKYVIQHYKDVHLKLRPFKCQICGKTYMRKQHLQDHQRTHSPEGSSFPKAAADGFTLEHPVPEDSSVSEMGSEDDLGTGTPAELDVDQLELVQIISTKTVNVNDPGIVTADRRPFKESPSRRESLSMAVKKNFKCNTCGKMFSYSRHVIQHHRDVHLKLRPFKCHICGKAFMRKSHLRTHQGSSNCVHEQLSRDKEPTPHRRYSGLSEEEDTSFTVEQIPEGDPEKYESEVKQELYDHNDDDDERYRNCQFVNS